MTGGAHRHIPSCVWRAFLNRSSHETTSARACSAQLDNDQPPPEIPGHVSAPNALIRPLHAEQLAAPSIRKRLHNALPLSANAMASHTRMRDMERREDAYLERAAALDLRLCYFVMFRLMSCSFLKVARPHVHTILLVQLSHPKCSQADESNTS